MTRITSRSNPTVAAVAALREKKHRAEQGRFLADGIKLFEEADQSGAPVETVILSDSALEKYTASHGDRLAKYPLISVPDGVFEKMSEEKSPEGVLTVVKGLDKIHKVTTIYNTENEGQSIFLLSSIRDPGNLGTMLRTAAAFGIDEVLLSEDCAEVTSPKTLRASMGAVFRQRTTVCTDFPASVRALRDAGIPVYAALPDHRAKPFAEIPGRAAYVVGNEGHGLDGDTIAACTGSVFIPMAQGTESLNAAVAAAILMYDCGMTRRGI